VKMRYIKRCIERWKTRSICAGVSLWV